MAAGIQAHPPVSPYGCFFGIPVTPRFVAVTLAAHVIFGVALGLYLAWYTRRWAPGRER